MLTTTLILLLCALISSSLPTGEFDDPPLNVTVIANSDSSTRKCGYALFDHSRNPPIFRDMQWLEFTGDDGCRGLRKELGEIVIYEGCACSLYRKSNQPFHACANEDQSAEAKGPGSASFWGKRISVYKCSDDF